MSLRPLKWVSVKVTPENQMDLQMLVEEYIEGIPYISYELIENRYTSSHNILKGIEEVIPDFSKLPEAKLMISLGMATRKVFNTLWGESE